MDKLEVATKRVEKYELKISKLLEELQSLGADPTISWSTFPAGSKERSLAVDISMINRDLDRAREALDKRKKIEEKKNNKQDDLKYEDKNENTSFKWMQSKTGMWHKVGFEMDSTYYPSCQSYNLDKPNALQGTAVDTPPVDGKVCKKCNSSNSGKGWAHI